MQLLAFERGLFDTMVAVLWCSAHFGLLLIDLVELANQEVVMVDLLLELFHQLDIFTRQVLPRRDWLGCQPLFIVWRRGQLYQPVRRIVVLRAPQVALLVFLPTMVNPHLSLHFQGGLRTSHPQLLAT